MLSFLSRTFAVLALLLSPGSALAQAPTDLCGPTPALPTQLETNDYQKREIQGQAKFLSGLVGKAELGGQVETARKNIYQNSQDFMAAQKDAYLSYLFCVFIMQDKNLSTPDKLKSLEEFRKPIAAGPRTDNSTSRPPAPEFLFINRNLPFGRIQEVLGGPNSQEEGKDKSVAYSTFEDASMIYYAAFKGTKMLGFAALFKASPEILEPQMRAKGITMEAASLDSLKSRFGKNGTVYLGSPGKPAIIFIDNVELFGKTDYTLVFWFEGSITCDPPKDGATLGSLKCTGSTDRGRLVAIASSYDYEAILGDSSLSYNAVRFRDERVASANLRLLRKSEVENSFISRYLSPRGLN